MSVSEEIKRLTSTYNKEKKFLLKIIKILSITVIILMTELLLSFVYGKESITILIDLIERFVK